MSNKRKEWLLNIATNRWQLNRPKYVGKVAEEIRQCSPKKLEDWIEYYREKVRPNKYEDMRKHIPELTIDHYLELLGLELCKRIHENIRKEIESITDEDCVSYIRELVFNRTFQGYIREKQTVYQRLEDMLGVKIEPAPDIWDRKYNIDFYIKCKNGIIGLQIKPITYQQTPQVHNWRSWLKASHERFKREVGGEVFVIFSVKKDKGVKYIYNEDELVESIRKAMILSGGPA
ncbi:MAG: MjaI family restriction endonuclease [Aquificota bacterium]|jgi:hypothetical protein|nr:MAG: MjaI family restriction endonuclease [Aquificota bacterium]